MALTAALKVAHAAADDAVASHAAAETLVNNPRNTIAQLPLATRSSDAQPATTADRAALDPNLDLAQRATSATKSQLDGARALLSMLIDASMSSDPPVPDGTYAPSSTASTAAATVPADSATLAFGLARAEANTLAKQSTETWPQVNVPTILEYDMKNYALGRPAQRISKYGITMMTGNACDAGRLQAEQRKSSKHRIIMMPSNASNAS
jgi:hypothetical protein